MMWTQFNYLDGVRLDLILEVVVKDTLGDGFANYKQVIRQGSYIDIVGEINNCGWIRFILL